MAESGKKNWKILLIFQLLKPSVKYQIFQYPYWDGKSKTNVEYCKTILYQKIQKTIILLKTNPRFSLKKITLD